MAKVLFFDGICVMCNGLVGFALRHDKKHVFKYATLQGETAKRLVPHLAPDEAKSVVLLDETGVHTESDAIIRLLIGLGGVLKLAYLLWIFPRFLRNAVYRLIARNRYRWFGTTESCALLSQEQRAQILD